MFKDLAWTRAESEGKKRFLEGRLMEETLESSEGLKGTDELGGENRGGWMAWSAQRPGHGNYERLAPAGRGHT